MEAPPAVEMEEEEELDEDLLRLLDMGTVPSQEPTVVPTAPLPSPSPSPSPSQVPSTLPTPSRPVVPVSTPRPQRPPPTTHSIPVPVPVPIPVKREGERRPLPPQRAAVNLRPVAPEEEDIADIPAARGKEVPRFQRVLDFPYKRIPPEEATRIGARLREPIDSTLISFRQGPGGAFLAYISGETARSLADSVFGWNTWSFILTSLNSNVNPTFVVAQGRLIVGDVIRENVGVGKGRGQLPGSIEIATKAAVTDCFKRCLATYGYSVGGMLYDPAQTQELIKNRPQQPPPRRT